MKKLILIILSSVSISAMAGEIQTSIPRTSQSSKQPVEFYGGLVLGNVTQTKTDGTEDRENLFSYGVEAIAFRKQFGLGLGYRDFKQEKEGNAAVNVEQKNQWLELDGAYRFNYDSDYVPYGFVGIGVINKAVTTTVMSQSETSSANNLSRSIGAGFFLKAEKSWAMNFALRYYQYAAQIPHLYR